MALFGVEKTLLQVRCDCNAGVSRPCTRCAHTILQVHSETREVHKSAMAPAFLDQITPLHLYNDQPRLHLRSATCPLSPSSHPRGKYPR